MRELSDEAAADASSRRSRRIGVFHERRWNRLASSRYPLLSWRRSSSAIVSSIGGSVIGTRQASVNSSSGGSCTIAVVVSRFRPSATGLPPPFPYPSPNQTGSALLPIVSSCLRVMCQQVMGLGSSSLPPSGLWSVTAAPQARHSPLRLHPPATPSSTPPCRWPTRGPRGAPPSPHCDFRVSTG